MATKKSKLCKICQTPTLEIIDFGEMPIANGFVSKITQDKFRFTLSVAFCPKCYMVQLTDAVPPQKMFNENYHFLSSTSKTMEIHFREVADEILKLISKKKDPFVVEIGSNDGIMLKHIASKKIRQLGIEPSSNVADMSKKYGVIVSKEFFNQKHAKEIVKKYGNADVMFGANVICHIENINSVFEGVSTLLKKDGVFFFEEPYIYDIVSKSSFDQIYDEHIYFYSGLSVKELAKKHNLQLIDMKHQDVHGGSMRYYIKQGKNNKETKRMKSFIKKEKQIRLNKIQGYLLFKDHVNKVCEDLRNLLLKIKKEGNRINAYGATSKSTTLLSYAKIGKEIIDCIYDTTPTKIGKFTPGTHIPVKSYVGFAKDKTRNTLLLAWNHKKEIFEKEKTYRKNGGKFITFFPKVIVE
jgi:methylation protein EvaC